MQNCARVSFNGCVEKKIEKSAWDCSKYNPNNLGKAFPCEEMGKTF